MKNHLARFEGDRKETWAVEVAENSLTVVSFSPFTVFCGLPVSALCLVYLDRPRFKRIDKTCWNKAFSVYDTQSALERKSCLP